MCQTRGLELLLALNQNNIKIENQHKSLINHINPLVILVQRVVNELRIHRFLRKQQVELLLWIHNQEEVAHDKWIIQLITATLASEKNLSFIPKIWSYNIVL